MDSYVSIQVVRVLIAQTGKSVQLEQLVFLKQGHEFQLNLVEIQHLVQQVQRVLIINIAFQLVGQEELVLVDKHVVLKIHVFFQILVRRITIVLHLTYVLMGPVQVIHVFIHQIVRMELSVIVEEVVNL